MANARKVFETFSKFIKDGQEQKESGASPTAIKLFKEKLANATDEEVSTGKITTGYVDRIFDALPANAVADFIDFSTYAYHYIKIITTGVSDTDFLSGLIRIAKSIVLATPQKLQPGLVEFLNIHSPAFMARYEQLSKSEQEQVVDSLVFSIAHGIFQSISSMTEKTIFDYFKAPDSTKKTGELTSEDLEALKNYSSAMNKRAYPIPKHISDIIKSERELLKKKSKSIEAATRDLEDYEDSAVLKIKIKTSYLTLEDKLENYLNNTIAWQTKSSSQNISLMSLKDEAKKINKEHNLGLKQNPSRYDMSLEDQLLAYIGEKHPSIILNIKKHWQYQSIATEDIDVILNKTGLVKEKKVSAKTTSSIFGISKPIQKQSTSQLRDSTISTEQYAGELKTPKK